MGFELPFSVTGFGMDHSNADIVARRDAFLSWARAVGASLDSAVIEVEAAEEHASFDAVHLELVGVWLLHNRYVPLLGVLPVAPVPGDAWAVAGEYTDLELPEHVAAWGPTVIAGAALNAPLETNLDGLGLGAQEQADRYKPETVGHVVFNYWREGSR